MNEMNNEDIQQHTSTIPIVMVCDLTRIYRPGQSEVLALKRISLDIYPGEFVAVTGPSGSGKSTFMNIVGCMDRPTSGEYRLKGQLVSKLQPHQLALVRSRHLGFIFQNFAQNSGWCLWGD